MASEKIKIPDGMGGFKLVDANKFSDGSNANYNKQESILVTEAANASWERVGHAAEYFNKVHRIYATEQSLDTEELVRAVYLELLNMKEFFPKDLGGPDKFDEFCKEAFAWFEENKGK